METARAPHVGLPSPRGPSSSQADTWVSPVAALAAALRNTTAAVVAWSANLPHRVGDQLHARNDEEARWRGLQVSELARGLARQYRDSRFGTLRDTCDPHTDRLEVDGEC